MAIEPSPTSWQFPAAEEWPEDDLVAVGADLGAGTLLKAYRRGLFPMPVPVEGSQEVLGWFSPEFRGVLPLDGLRVTRSMRASAKRFEITVNAAFDEVVAACADPARSHGWITPAIQAAYAQLHRLGWAHSVEAWQGGRLAGGLYGVQIGGLFAGESMFFRVRDASKVALMGLVDRLRGDDEDRRLVDVQWSTEHLASLGVVEVDRDAYLGRLPQALTLTPRLSGGER